MPQLDGSVAPQIAQSFQTTDGTAWTISLRPKVKFSDGTPLDAVAVKFNWDRIADPATKSPNIGLMANVASTQVLSPTTLQVTLKSPSGSFPSTVAYSSLNWIGSPAALKAKSPADLAFAPVGAGPYVVQNFVQGSQMTLVRNTHYYGTAHLSKIVFRFFTDPVQEVNAMLGGQCDLTWTTYQNQANQLANTHKFGEFVASPQGGYSMAFNVTKPPFNNPDARMAVSEVLNDPAMNQALFAGRGQPADTLFKDGSPYQDKTATFPAPNKQHAQQLFDKLAGDNAGKPFRFEILVPQSSITPRAEWLKAYIDSNFKNVKVTLSEVTPAAYVVAIRAGNFQAVATLLRFSDLSVLGNILGTGAPQNYMGYSNAQVDAALAKAKTTTGEETRKASVDQVQRALVRDLPDVVYERLLEENFYAKNVHPEFWVESIPRWDGITKSGS